MSGDAGSDRVTRHDHGWTALSNLDRVIDGLESLRNRIKGDDSPKTTENLPDAPAPALSEFVARLGEDIETKSTRISDLIQTIREALF